MIKIPSSEKDSIAYRKQLKCGGPTLISKMAALRPADGQLLLKRVINPFSEQNIQSDITQGI